MSDLQARLTASIDMTLAMEKYRITWWTTFRLGLPCSHLRLPPMSSAMADAARQEARLFPLKFSKRHQDGRAMAILHRDASRAIEAAIIGVDG